MIRRTNAICICAFLLALNLIFIWGNSLLPADMSKAISDWVAELLPDREEMSVSPNQEAKILRKAAHFTEFTALGFLLSWMAILLKKRQHYALLSGVMAACIDETIQIFVPERGPGLTDVLIDAGGVAAGMILLCLGNAIVRKIRNIQLGG